LYRYCRIGSVQGLMSDTTRTNPNPGLKARRWSPVGFFVLEDDRVVDRSCSGTFEVGSGGATVIVGGSESRDGVMIKYKKLANLGFQASSIHRAQEIKIIVDLVPKAILLFDNAMAPATRMNFNSACLFYESLRLYRSAAALSQGRSPPRLSNWSRTGLPMSSKKPNIDPQWRKAILAPPVRRTSNFGSMPPRCQTISG
jgi:hypothetical protein